VSISEYVIMVVECVILSTCTSAVICTVIGKVYRNKGLDNKLFEPLLFTLFIASFIIGNIKIF
jgi:hypothetical protein